MFLFRNNFVNKASEFLFGDKEVRLLEVDTLLKLFSVFLPYYVSANDRPLNPPSWTKHQLCEIAIPTRFFRRALTDINALFKKYETQRNWALAGVIVIYQLPKDTSAVFSRSYSEDHTALDMFHGDWTEPIFADIVNDFINLLLNNYQGKIHMSKTAGKGNVLRMKNYNFGLLSQYKNRIDRKLMNPFFEQLFPEPQMSAMMIPKF